MKILVINYVSEWVQIISGSRKYTCPTKMINGELFFIFKKEWHKAADYISEFTTEFKE